MNELSKRKCEVCNSDAAQVSEEETSRLKPFIPDWELIRSDDGISKLKRSFPFLNFKKAIEFTNKIARFAEEENHHPTIITEWGKVTVIWWTHKIKGLHINDFIMASKTDTLI